MWCEDFNDWIDYSNDINDIPEKCKINVIFKTSPEYCSSPISVDLESTPEIHNQESSSSSGVPASSVSSAIDTG